MKYSLRIGPISVSLVGEGWLFDLVWSDLHASMGSAIPGTLEEGPDLVIKILGENEEIDFSPRYYSGNISFDDENFLVSEKFFTYLVRDLRSGSPTTVIVKPKSRRNIQPRIRFFLGTVFQLFSQGYGNFGSRVKHRFLSYSVFWYILHLVLLNKDAGLIHAASARLGSGDGIMLAGTGGCGKTSTVLKLLESQGSQYLSEDLGIIDKDGSAYLSCRKLAIYKSDVVRGLDCLDDFSDRHLNGVDKLSWRLNVAANRNPVRRIAVKELLQSEKVAESTRISTIYYMVRSDAKNISITDCSAKEMASRCVHASLRELKMVYEIFRHFGANNTGQSRLPLPEDIFEETASLYNNSFQDLERRILHLPRSAKPEEIVKSIMTPGRC